MRPSAANGAPGERDWRSPGKAFLLALVLPGFGQIYAGATRRGVVTTAGFLASLAVFVVSRDAADGTWPNLAWFALRSAIHLYVFAFVDAYYAASERDGGEGHSGADRPRVAAVWNALTGGVGYLLAGDPRRFFFVVTVLFAVRSKLVWSGDFVTPALSLRSQLLVEVAMLATAWDAWALVWRRRAEELRTRPTDAPLVESRSEPSSDLGPAAPVILAHAVLGAYWASLIVGLRGVPDRLPRLALDRSQEQRIAGDDGSEYRNPVYSLAFRVPPGWTFESGGDPELVRFAAPDGACTGGLLVRAAGVHEPLAAVADRIISTRKLGPAGAVRDRRTVRYQGRPGIEAILEVRRPKNVREIETLGVARDGERAYGLWVRSESARAVTCRREADAILLSLSLELDSGPTPALVLDRSKQEIVAADDGPTYRNPVYGIGLRLPAGWSFTPGADEDLVRFAAADGGCFGGILARKVPAHESAPAVADRIIASRGAESRPLVFQRRTVRFGERPGIEAVLEIRHSDGRWVERLGVARDDELAYAAWVRSDHRHAEGCLRAAGQILFEFAVKGGP